MKSQTIIFKHTNNSALLGKERKEGKKGKPKKQKTNLLRINIAIS
jgi:hypothetical protein